MQPCITQTHVCTHALLTEAKCCRLGSPTTSFHAALLCGDIHNALHKCTTRTHRDADTGIKCTHSRFQEVTSTSLQLATGSVVCLSLSCYSVMCLPFLGSARCRPLQRPHSRNYSEGIAGGRRRAAARRQQTSASSGQVTGGDRPAFTAPSVLKRQWVLGGSLRPSQRDTSCQAPSQHFL